MSEEENTFNNNLSNTNVGIFKTLDYDLDLKERHANFKKFDYVLCEDCDQEIESSNFICYNCFNKETDNNEKNRMSYGICKICFKSNTSLGCCKIFRTSDYDLCLNERIMKYKDYDHIFCEERTNCYMEYGICKMCFKSPLNAFSWCSSCKFEGPKVKFFKTSDYYLNLRKRKEKYKDYNHILCEGCDKSISTKVFYCTYCYDKEIDNNKKNQMKYGIEFVIFETPDYDLNLSERKEKYKDYDHIFCEKCNQEINKDYYCYDCYDKETDINERIWMKHGIEFVIFKTSDYDLNLKERKEKYLDRGRILCEECNQGISSKYCYCFDCYDKKTDNNEKNRMKYGICKVCFKSFKNAFGWCSSCKIEGPKAKIFKTSDYDLNLEEKKEKYLDYDHILCEECNVEICKKDYSCFPCYCIKTYNEKNRMKYGICKVCFKSFKNAFGWCSSCKIEGPKVKIFKISDYDLNLKEREEKYKDYDHIICEECNQEINKENYYCYCFYYNNIEHISCYSTYKQFLEDLYKWFHEYKVIDLPKEPEVGISDYDLNEDDRQVKYNDYDRILCEKCSKKIYYYCYDCYDKKTKELEKLQSKLLVGYEIFYSRLYDKETKELKELKELQSILKDYKNVYFKLNHNLSAVDQIINNGYTKYQQIEHVKTLIKNIRYNRVCECFCKIYSYCYDCYKETDSNEKKHIEFGRCKECFQTNDEGLDDCSFCRLKRIQRNFDRWTSGNETINKLIQDNQLSAKRYELLEWIPYDKFTDIKHIADGGFAKVYSATWNDGQIEKWSQLSNNWKRSEPLTVALKVLNNSENISKDFLNEVNFFNIINGHMCVIKCFGITQDPKTHNYALVLQYMESGDLRSYLRRTFNSLTWQRRLNNIYDICLALNNIHIHKLMHKDLHPGNIFIGTTFAYIGDFGFCMPANENLSNSTKNVYGVMPYMAPEILRKKPYTLASDVYSLGVIINEIITVIPPFSNQPHDYLLALDICRGLRPTIRAETPNSLKELIEKCWDADPEKRPTSEKIFETLSHNLNVYKNLPLKRSSYNFSNKSTKITSLFDKKMQLITHPQASYTSQLYNFQNLPEPMNYSNQEEFISSRIQPGKVIHSNESLEYCVIMDID